MLQLYHFPIIAAALFVTFFFQRWFRLRHIPGPWITSFTDLWRVYHQRNGQFPEKLRELHGKYGALVRLGPNSVCIGSAAGVSTVYTMHGEFKKADSYSPIRGYANGKVVGSFVDVQDEEKATGIRRALGATFATKNLLEYENDVDVAIEALLERLGKGDSIDATVLFRQFQIDFLSKAAFNENPHILATDGDLAPFDIRGRLIHAFRWQGAPRLEYLLFKTRIGNLLRKSPPPPLWIRSAAAKLQARSAEKPKFEGQRDLLDKYIAASHQYPQFMQQEMLLRIISSTISAGYDTTALTLMFLVTLLLKNLDKYEKLQKEIDEANLSNPPKWIEVNKLEYLDAVIKEVLRCHPIVTQPMERVVPAGGAVVCGKFLPAGTWVGAAAAAVHYDKDCFGEDAAVFRPERWIEASHEERVYMERGYLAFGAGKRNCIGKHIAELELKKTVPAMFMNYSMHSTDDKALQLAQTRIAGQDPIPITFEARS